MLDDTLSLTVEDDTTLTYHLRGVIYHIGESSESGHYTALVKKDDQWVLFDDNAALAMESIIFYTQSECKQRQCYMALYHL